MKMKHKLKCFNCGKTFKPGNNPYTGVPNGIGLMSESGKTYTICSQCISYRTNEANAKIMEAEGKPTKKVGNMILPEGFDVNEYEKFLEEHGKDPEIRAFFVNAEKGAKTGIRETIKNVKAMGIKLDENKKLGLIHHFSMEQAINIWNHIKNKPENDKIVTIGQALMRYYFAIYETIEAEEAVMGEEEN